VLSLTGAARGNVQVTDPATGSLRIVAHLGFDAEFLEYFALVDDDRSACGRAARRRSQIVIADTSTDPAFTAHRDAAAAAGFRAVWSTPLVDQAGRLLGVVSTHYPRPWSPTRRDLQMMELFGELAGQAMAARVAELPQPGEIRQADRFGRTPSW